MILITPIYYWIAIALIAALVIGFVVWYRSERKDWDEEMKEKNSDIRHHTIL